MNNILFKNISWLLIFNLMAPTTSFAKRTVDDGEDVDIRACGNFKVVADLPADADPMACRTDDKARDKRWKTKGGETELHISKEDLAKSKTVKQVMDDILLNMIQEKVKAKLKAFSWINAVQFYSQSDPEIAKKIKAVSEKYKEFQDNILADDGKGAKHQVQKLLTLYPDIEAEILDTHPDYKTLICKYELHKHREQHLKLAAKILGITATIVSLVGGPATAYFWIPALPKVLMLAGGANVLAGTLKIGDAVMKWDDVKAANTAKALLQFNSANETLIAKLKKNPENKEMVTYLQDHRLSSSEIDRLKNIKKLKRKEYAKFLGGLMNTTFGAASIYGGIWSGAKFGDFKATAPANVTQPYTGGTTGGDGGGTTGGYGTVDDGG